MSFEINYLIDTPGAQFNKILRTGAPENESDRRHWEDSLPGSSMSLTANLTGVVTLLWIPVRYSRLLDDTAGEIEVVRQWEKCLIEMAGSREIYRIDYFLIKDWDAGYGFDWIAERDLVDSFLAWLEQEDQLHWSRLTTAQRA